MKTLFFVIFCLCLETVLINTYHLRKQDSANPLASADATIEDAGLEKLRSDIRTNYEVLNSLTQKYQEEEKLLIEANNERVEAQNKECDDDKDKLAKAHAQEIDDYKKKLADSAKELSESNKKLLQTMKEIRDKERVELMEELYKLEKSDEDQYKNQLNHDETEISAQFKKEEIKAKADIQSQIDDLLEVESEKIRELNIEKQQKLNEAVAEGDDALERIRDNLKLSEDEMKHLTREVHEDRQKK